MITKNKLEKPRYIIPVFFGVIGVAMWLYGVLGTDVPSGLVTHGINALQWSFIVHLMFENASLRRFLTAPDETEDDQ